MSKEVEQNSDLSKFIPLDVLDLTPILHQKYDRGKYPWLVDIAQLPNGEGINCQTAVHWFFHQLGIEIPREMGSLEFYYDEEYFRTIDFKDRKELIFGDVCLFGPDGYETDEDYKLLHLAVVLGSVKGDILLFHASMKDGETCIQMYEDFFNNPRHQVLYRVKRLNLTSSIFQFQSKEL